MTFYRVKKDNSKNRIKIGSIPTASMQYYHSFGHTKDSVFIPKNSVTYSMAGMAAGHSVEDCLLLNWKNNLDFYYMSLEDGTYKTFHADHPGFILHTGNTYVEDDILTIDFEMNVIDYMPFEVYSMKWLKDNNRVPLK
jgi:carotenoid cleavage dioxygenase-like enzyme